MLVNDMQIGKTLEILLIRDGYRYHFVSKIEGVAGSSVAVSLIATANRVFRFEEQDEITIVYRGVDRMWKWENAKGGVAKLDGYPVHTFTSRTEGKSYNRRESFRVPIGEQQLMKKIRKFSEQEQQEAVLKAQETEAKNNEDKKEEVPFEEMIPFDAYLSDLSCTGAGLYTNEKLEIGSEICFELITNMGLISCRGTIIREADVFDRPFRHFYGCDFSKVTAGLDRYLTEKQRLILQRERGGETVRKRG